MKRILSIIISLKGYSWLAKYIVLGIISGLSSFLFIHLVTRSIGSLINDDLKYVRNKYILLFLAIILIFTWSRRWLSFAIIEMSQSLFKDLRKEFISLILNSGYKEVLEKKSRIQSAIVNDVNLLTQVSVTIIDFLTAIVLALSCLIYLAYISFALFLITLFVTFIGVYSYYVSSKKNATNFQKAHALEDSFIEHFGSILNGFKEIYMEPGIGKYICRAKLDYLSKDTYQNNVSAFSGYLNNQIIGQVLFYLLISSIILFFNDYFNIQSNDIISFVFTMIYLLGAIQTIMAIMPSLGRANVASDHIVDLKLELESSETAREEVVRYISKDEFEEVTVKNMEFCHGKTDQSFSIGPVDFKIKKGQIIFIYGGNGSGKSTFVHCVLGLLFPTGGEISYNHIPVVKANYSTYRTIFCAVFSDFYLFSEIFTINELDVDQLNYYIRLFELQEKVELRGNTFSVTSLSTGQRKRLALISALLQEKPVLVLDEWAADQDPHFRRKFYITILPLLRAKGFTILAVTHDDSYYNCCDQLFKMKDGILIPEKQVIFHINR